jgi:hypothetical protein
MGSSAALEKLNAALSTTRTVDVVPGFVDLAAQGLALLGRKPPLARLLGLVAAIAAAAVPFGTLATGIGGLVSFIPGLARILVPLLSQPRHRACNQE